MKWGILGPGRIAHRFAKALQAEFVGELYAVASRDYQLANAFAAQYQAEKAYASYQELLADPLVDVVYIATPHMFHFEQVKLCLAKGKHVLCEKPLTLNAKQATELFDLAKQANLFLMEAMWTPFLPAYQQILQWIAQGKIGTLKHIQSNFGFNVPKNKQDRLLNRDLAGGVLLDMGVYNVATALLLTQSYPAQIQALGWVGDTQVDEMTLVNLAFPNQIVAQFSCNFHCQTDNSLWITGTEGRIQLHDTFWEATKVTLTTNENVLAQQFEFPFAVNGFEYEIAEVEQCIKQGLLNSSIMSADKTIATMQVMDQIRAQLGIVYDNEGI